MGIEGDGRGMGHDDRYYQAVNQRFLGDEKFVGQIAERAPKGEIRPGGRKLRFEKLLPAVAQVDGFGVNDLTAAGRQRARAKPRVQLAYLARDWCAMQTVVINWLDGSREQLRQFGMNATLQRKTRVSSRG